MKNKFLIWLNIILFLGAVLLLFEVQKKGVDIYDDPVLQYFGASKAEIINMYGEPDYKREIGGPGGEAIFYEDMKISFIFAGDERGVVNNLELYPGREFLGVEVGMNFDEIEGVLGTPRTRGYDPYKKDYTMLYYFGEEKEGMGEVEVWFSATEDTAPTTRAQVFWKKYWR